MLTLTQDLQKEMHLTVLMVTHQPEDARQIADQVIFVDGGTVRQPVPTMNFFAKQDEAVARYLGEVG